MEKMEYKGFIGTVEYSIEAGCLYGCVDNVAASISYEAEDFHKLEKAFQMRSTTIWR